MDWQAVALSGNPHRWVATPNRVPLDLVVRFPAPARRRGGIEQAIRGRFPDEHVKLAKRATCGNYGVAVALAAGGLSVLPAATAGLVALLDRHQAEKLDNDRYVAILTGRKS